jgi:peptide/nickel transport system permease protein
MVTAIARAPAITLAEPRRSRRSLWRAMRRNRSVQIGLTLVASLSLLALLAPLLATHRPNEMQMTQILAPPSREHLLGTDDFGRDVFTRVLYGARLSIFIGLAVAACTTVIGLVLGTLSGYYRRLDNVIMRMMDVLMAFPGILLALGIMAILGPRLSNVIIALVVGFTPGTARLVRAEILALREREFAEAARALGGSDGRIIARHLVPNAMAPLLVQQTAVIAAAVLAESGLNFLGIGLPPDVPTLGGTLAASRSFLRDAYWMALFPGLVISVFVLGANLLGDGLRDIFDPHLND